MGRADTLRAELFSLSRLIREESSASDDGQASKPPQAAEQAVEGFRNDAVDRLARQFRHYTTTARAGNSVAVLDSICLHPSLSLDLMPVSPSRPNSQIGLLARDEVPL